LSQHRIPVGILGATGSVGQRLVHLLADHPLFAIHELAASNRHDGKRYGESVRWVQSSPLPQAIADLPVLRSAPGLKSRLLFSALDASVAGEVEESLARAGHIIVSNARNHRFDPLVPLLVPEINADHLEILPRQTYGEGAIVTNPNCSTIGLALALKPLHDLFGLEAVNVVTMQAVSGAGYPGVAAIDIHDNVIPFIRGEEEKIEQEPRKILGRLGKDGIEPAELRISAQCNRVAVLDGHLESVQVKLRTPASKGDIVGAWDQFRGPPQLLGLHSAPRKPVHYLPGEDHPQPRLHRDLERGMAAAVGRLRECPLFDYKFTVLSHNTVRGAAGGTLLCAEIMVARGIRVQ
jgi:aspartate-semialdehyde dehydrogenase